LVIGVAVGVLATAVLWAVAPFVAGWFTADPETRDAIESAFTILVLMQPVAAIVFVWDGVFIGAGDFGFLAIAMVVSSAIAVGLLGLVLPLDWGLDGVWWSLGALLWLRGLTLAWRRAARQGPFANPARG
jgi:MATE family multidrug resistance protein